MDGPTSAVVVLSEKEVARFLDESAMLATTEALERHVLSDAAFRELRSRIESAALSVADVEAFVDGLLVEFRPGRTFYGDKVLALVAMVLETGPEPFANRFLDELASLECAEIPLASRMARRILHRRKPFFPSTAIRTEVISDPAYGADEIILVETIVGSNEKPPQDRSVTMNFLNLAA